MHSHCRSNPIRCLVICFTLIAICRCTHFSAVEAIYVNGVGYSTFGPLSATSLTLQGYDVGAKLDSIQNSLTQMQSQINEQALLIQSQSSQASDIASLTLQLESQNNTLISQSSMLSQLTAQLNQMKIENSALRYDVDTLKRQNADLIANVTKTALVDEAQQGKLDELYDEISSIHISIADINSQMKNSIHDIQYDVNVLKVQSAELQMNLTANIVFDSTQQAVLDSLSIDVSDMSTQMSGVSTLALETLDSIQRTEASVAVQAATLAVMTSVNSTNVAGMVGALQVRVDMQATQLTQLDAANSGQAEIINYHDTKITSLQSDLASAQSTISQHTSQIQSLQSTGSSQAQAISTLQSNMVSTQQLASLANTTLTSALSDLSSIVSALSSRVTASAADVSDKLSSVSSDALTQTAVTNALAARVSVTEVSIKTLNVTLTTQASTLVSTQTAAISLSARVNVTESNDAQLNSRVTSLESGLNSLQSRVSALNNSISHATAPTYDLSSITNPVSPPSDLSDLTSRVSQLEQWNASSQQAAQAMNVRVAAAESLIYSQGSMITALNHTGEWQGSESNSVHSIMTRNAWVTNPSLAPITVQRSGTYVVLGQARLGYLDTLNDYWWKVTLFKNNSAGLIPLTTSLAGLTPPVSQGATLVLSAGDHSQDINFVGSFAAGDQILMQYWVAGTGTGTLPWALISNGNSINKVEIFLIHPDSANTITPVASSSSSSTNAASSTDVAALQSSNAALTARVGQLEATTVLLNASLLVQSSGVNTRLSTAESAIGYHTVQISTLQSTSTSSLVRLQQLEITSNLSLAIQANLTRRMSVVEGGLNSLSNRMTAAEMLSAGSSPLVNAVTQLQASQGNSAGSSFMLTPLGGLDLGPSTGSDWKGSLRNQWFSSPVSPNVTIPVGGNGSYLITIQGRVRGLASDDEFWFVAALLTHAGSNSTRSLCVSLRAVDSAVPGALLRGDDSRTCSQVVSLNEGDQLKLAYYVGTTSGVPTSGSQFTYGWAQGSSGSSLYAIPLFFNAPNDAMNALSARVSATESMLIALNHTGDWQSRQYSNIPTSALRSQWVANPGLPTMTVQRSGIYQIIAQARVAPIDSTLDSWWKAGIFSGGSSGTRLTSSMGGKQPGSGSLGAGDQSVCLSFYGHLQEGESISMLYWVQGTGSSSYGFYNDAEGVNRIDMTLLHADSANLIAIPALWSGSSGSYSNAGVSSSTDLSSLLASTVSLTSRVQLLEASNISTQSTISSLSTRMSLAESNYNSLSSTLGMQSTMISSLLASNISVQSGLSSLAYRMSAAEVSAAQLQGIVVAQSPQITALQSANVSVQSAVTSLSIRMTAAESLTGTTSLVSTLVGIRDLSVTTTNIAAALIGMRDLSVVTSNLAAAVIGMRDLTVTGSTIASTLIAIRDLTGNSNIVNTVGASQTSTNNHQTRLLNVETLTGTSTLIAQFMGLRDLSIVTTNLAAAVVGMRDLSASSTIASTVLGMRDLSVITSNLAAAVIGMRDLTVTGSTIASTLIAIRDLTGTSNLVNTVGASQTSTNNHQTRLFNLETLTGSSTLVSQFLGLRDLTIITSNLALTVVGMRDLTGTTTNLYANVVGMRDMSAASILVNTLTGIRDLTGSSNIVNTVGSAQSSTNNHQTRLLNLETVSGTSTLVSQFIGVRDLTGTSPIVTTVGTAQIASNNLQQRLINVETLTGTSTLIVQFMGLRDLSITTSLLASTLLGLRDNTVAGAGALLAKVSGLDTRLTSAEALTGTTSLVSTVTGLRDNIGTYPLLIQVSALTTNSRSLNSSLLQLQNAKLNFSLNVLGGSDTSTNPTDYAQTTRNAWIVSVSSPTITIPSTGNYLLTAKGRAQTLSAATPTDGYWGFGIRVQRGSTSFILSPVLSDAPPEIVGLISRGDNNRVTFWSGPLQANDVIQLTYIVNTASATTGPTWYVGGAGSAGWQSLFAVPLFNSGGNLIPAPSFVGSSSSPYSPSSTDLALASLTNRVQMLELANSSVQSTVSTLGNRVSNHTFQLAQVSSRISSLTPYTPTFTSFTTGNGICRFFYRRVGEDMMITGSIFFGSTTGIPGRFDFSLPNGYTINHARTAGNGVGGDWARLGYAVVWSGVPKGVYQVQIAGTSLTQFYIYGQDPSNNLGPDSGWVGFNWPMVWIPNSELHISEFAVPIVEWQ